ncbi:MAG TPA: type II toxin-antitoxin system VapC family toxin [Candidatus Dormibacteraeota bacterium]|nr:type II toxin-antitoxin system VapC family toxin [Candidatus Dormibacteraeota bacterium]
MTSSSQLLIDSHILIWLLYEPEKLSPQTQDILRSAEAVYLSPVSLWELALKYRKNKLIYSPKELAKGARELNLDRLPLKDEHLLTLPEIKLPHEDPFDTLLIAQSETEGYVFLTADKHLLQSKYNTLVC